MNAVVKPRTFVQQRLDDERRYGERAELDHLEPDELARHLRDTWRGPDNDIASFMCDALAEIDNRKRLNALVEALLMGSITVEQQNELNALIANQMLAHGITVINQAIRRGA